MEDTDLIAPLVPNKGDTDDTDDDQQSIDRISSIDSVPNKVDTDDTKDDQQPIDRISSIDSDSRRSPAAPQTSSRRSNLKRPTAEMAPQSPVSKRRGQRSISQPHNFRDLLDPEVDQEAAAIAALSQALRHNVHPYVDSLPHCPSGR
ncbi:hypothetical protein NOR_02744 [Metarhizium rileyi]|uniref:Uncharacterized protein n=1 Tax=Metarhizium rileyi (strain RCEF 4871) TaxID=1649241 RepID=A0A162JPC0_METRR|nr:hypothetical protein NOR_02744 [Metarhizium rileyi RCEF 4871]